VRQQWGRAGEMEAETHLKGKEAIKAVVKRSCGEIKDRILKEGFSGQKNKRRLGIGRGAYQGMEAQEDIERGGVIAWYPHTARSFHLL
jgi:hypothetical protein